MTQLSIDLPAGAGREDAQTRLDGHEDWLELRAWAQRAVAVITPKSVCYVLDVSASTLSALLAETETEADANKGTDKRKRRLPGEYLAVIVRMAPAPMQIEYLQLQARHLGLVVTAPRILTDAEELAARRAFASTYAPGVLQAEDEHIKHLRGMR